MECTFSVPTQKILYFPKKHLLYEDAFLFHSQAQIYQYLFSDKCLNSSSHSTMCYCSQAMEVWVITYNDTCPLAPPCRVPSLLENVQKKCGKLRVDIIILYHIVHEQQICMLFELCSMHNSVAYYLSIMKCMRENVVKHLQNMIKYNVSCKQITYYICIVR